MKRNKYLDLLLVSPGSRYQADFIFGIGISTVLNAESSQLAHTLHMGSTVESRSLEP